MPQKRKRNLLDTRLQSTQTPLCVLDAARKIRFVSPAFEQLTGWSADQLEGLVCDPSTSSTATELLTAGLAPGPDVLLGSSQSVTTLIPQRSGAGLRCRLTFLPIKDADGTVDRILLLCDREKAARSSPVASLPQKLHAELTTLRLEHRRRFDGDSFIGSSSAIRRGRRQAEMLAATDLPYSISGPAGSGRRHLARLIHSTSGQADRSLVTLSCRLLSAEQLLDAVRMLRQESTATSGRHLHCGTLVLTEFDQFPREVQSWMLEQVPIEDAGIRLVAVGERSLNELLADGWLLPQTADLFGAGEVRLPRLHERVEDIPLLAQHFISECRRLNDTSAESLTDDVLAELEFYRWPGQVAELRQIIFEACQNSFTDRIQSEDLPFAFRSGLQAQQMPQQPQVAVASLEEMMEQFETDVIAAALEACGGNKAEAARRLGMTRPRLYRRMQSLKMNTDET